MSVAAVLATLVLVMFGRPAFGRFIGAVNPVVAVVAVSLILAAITPAALGKGIFTIVGKDTARGVLVSASIAALFGLFIVMVDVNVVLPRGLNVAYPESILLYPVIGYGVEILFHALPFFAVALVIGSRIERPAFLWSAIALIAALEPAFQAVAGFTSVYPAWVTALVSLHIFAINVCQLAVFRRYDFVSMYAFRIVYYLFWHIGWGHFRLQILF